MVVVVVVVVDATRLTDVMLA